MNLWKLTLCVDLQQVPLAEDMLEGYAEAISSFEIESSTNWKIEAYLLPHYEKQFIEDELIFSIKTKLCLDLEAIFLELLPRIDWLSACYASFPPLIAGRFFIHGSHIKDAIPNGYIPIEINAATAFGSGEHQSTFGCLLALSLLSKKISPKTILDMGTGTGILAIAAAKLFHKQTLAVDCDAESVRVAQENATLNQVGSLIHAYHGNGYKSQKVKNKHFDIIFANILARPLISMAPDLARALNPKGFAILAGLLNKQANMVIHAHRQQGLTLYKKLKLGEWTCLLLTKPTTL